MVLLDIMADAAPSEGEDSDVRVVLQQGLRVRSRAFANVYRVLWSCVVAVEA